MLVCHTKINEGPNQACDGNVIYSNLGTSVPDTGV